MHSLPLERLKKRSEFLAVAKTGERWVMPAFVIQVYRRVLEGSTRCGITASRKVGGAVERNRAKRRLRALIKQIFPLHSCPGTDYVLIAREEILRRDFACMAQELEEALRRIQRRLCNS